MKPVQKALVACGIPAPLLHIGTDILAVTLYEVHSYVNHKASQLSTIEAPTALLWNVIARIWGLLAIAFGVGVWLSVGRKRSLRVAGILIVTGASSQTVA